MTGAELFTTILSATRAGASGSSHDSAYGSATTMGALSTDRPEAHSLEARLAFAGKALAARVVSESSHTFLERFVREPSA